MFARVALHLPMGEQTGDSGHGGISHGRAQRCVHRSWRRLSDAHRGRTGTASGSISGSERASGRAADCELGEFPDRLREPATGGFRNLRTAASGVSAAAGQPPQGPSVSVDLTTDPNPPAHGKNKLTVTLKRPGGTVAGAQVSVTFYMAAMPSMGMAAMKAQSTLTDKGKGTYREASIFKAVGPGR